jgi:hypothetical protein
VAKLLAKRLIREGPPFGRGFAADLAADLAAGFLSRFILPLDCRLPFCRISLARQRMGR